jgi:hypothetical protein
LAENNSGNLYTIGNINIGTSEPRAKIIGADKIIKN